MADALGIETRSRSRSKTPGFENGDSGKKAKKIPTISLIEEEDDVVEVPSSQTSQGTRPKRPRRSVKAVTADTSGDAPIESPKIAQKVVVSSTTTVTEMVTKTTNGSEEASSTTTTTKTATNGDESQSIFNNIFNAIKTSTPILSNKRSKRVTQNVSSSGPVNDADHPAYKEYREAGEYWNKFPKTDYTYSELSPHRRELSNGMVAMPNMSRKSLDKYNARVESMIHNNPLDETYIRRKFFSNTNSSFQKRSADLQYDSTDEVDVSDFRKMLQERRKQNTNVVTRFFVTVMSFFSSSFSQVKSTVFGSKQNYAYTPVRHAKQGEIGNFCYLGEVSSISNRFSGIVSSSFDSVKRFVLIGFSKVYVFLSTILCLDTWLLHTRSDNHVENRKRKFFLLLLLAFLPLLLLGGEYNLIFLPRNSSRNIKKLEPKSFGFFSFHSFFLQELTFTLTHLKISPSPRFPSPNFHFLPSLNFHFLRCPS